MPALIVPTVDVHAWFLAAMAEFMADGDKVAAQIAVHGRTNTDSSGRSPSATGSGSSDRRSGP